MSVQHLVLAVARADAWSRTSEQWMRVLVHPVLSAAVPSSGIAGSRAEQSFWAGFSDLLLFFLFLSLLIITEGCVLS